MKTFLKRFLARIWRIVCSISDFFYSFNLIMAVLAMQFGAHFAISWPLFMYILIHFLRRPSESLVLSTLFILFIVTGLPVAVVSTAAFTLHRLFIPSSWKSAWLAATVFFSLALAFGIATNSKLPFSTIGLSAIVACNILTIIISRLAAGRILRRFETKWSGWAYLFRRELFPNPAVQALDTLLPPIVVLAAAIAYVGLFDDLIAAQPAATVVLYGVIAAGVPIWVNLFLRRLPMITPERASSLPGWRRCCGFWTLVLPPRLLERHAHCVVVPRRNGACKF